VLIAESCERLLTITKERGIYDRPRPESVAKAG